MKSKAMSREEWNKIIDDELEKDKSLIGKESVAVRGGTEYLPVPRPDNLITASMIAAYARGAMGDPDPLYTDPEYGKYTRWGGMIAPPTFISMFGPFSLNIHPLDLPYVPCWHKSTTYNYENSMLIRPGDEIHVSYKYLGYKEDKNLDKPYRLLEQYGRAKCYNQRDELIANVEMTELVFLVFPGDKAANDVLFTDMGFAGREKKPEYSEEQLEAVYKFYDDELEGKHWRGAEIRYWEDIKEGESIPELIEGPLQITDVFLSGVGRIGAFAAGWESIRQQPGRALKDPETGVYQLGTARHYSDISAQSIGLPFALAVGQNEAGMAHAVCNWKGDDALVKRWYVRHLSARFFGDMAYIKGKVVKKYIEQDEHLVDLEVQMEVQGGLVVSTGIVTIILVSRG